MAVGFDLIQAVIAQLESGTAAQQAFGDTWSQSTQTGTAKFFADLVDQVPPPYCLIEEGGENYEYMTEAPQGDINFMSTGQMSFKVFAPSRILARQLGFAIAASLNDAALTWPAQNGTMLFRMDRSWFLPMSEPSGPNVAVLFCRAFIFTYQYSGSLQLFS